MTLAALNITAHPHSREIYINLLKKAYQLRRVEPFYGDRAGMIAALAEHDDQQILSGQLVTFTRVDLSDEWFDIRASEFRSPDEVLDEIQLPDHLKPKSRAHPFIFFPDAHILVYQSRTTQSHRLGPSNAERLLARIFGADELLQEFGQVDVTSVPSAESLDRIFSMDMRHLKILVKRPNPDDYGDESRILQRLAGQNASQLQEEYRAEHGKALQPDDDTRRLARVAERNGYVEAEGTEQGEPAKESTRNHPWLETVKVYEGETPISIFIRTAKQLAKRIVARSTDE